MKRQVTLFMLLGSVIMLLLAGLMLFAPSEVVLSAPPPLPTMTPTASPAPPVRPASGTVIALRVKPTSAQLWTVVHWQDGEGEWHIVDGWRGELDMIAKSEGWKWWFFGRDLFGRGPFRWQVYTADAETLLATSESFDLPDNDGEWFIVDVFLYE